VRVGVMTVLQVSRVNFVTLDLVSAQAHLATTRAGRSRTN